MVSVETVSEQPIRRLETVGALDMGGASMQVGFEITTSEQLKALVSTQLDERHERSPPTVKQWRLPWVEARIPTQSSVPDLLLTPDNTPVLLPTPD